MFVLRGGPISCSEPFTLCQPLQRRVMEKTEKEYGKLSLDQFKRLRDLKLPVPLSPTALADEGYYCFIEDAIQLLMARISVYPCVFDACAFASFEKNA